MTSLPSIDQANIQKYWDIVRRLEPEYYLIRLLLQETGVNPAILPKVVRGLSNLSLGAGYGKVVVYVQNKKVTNVETVETDRLDQPATVTREVFDVFIKEKI
jgi:hypothetical protein